MVGTDGVTDVGLLLVLLGNLGAIECVRHLALLVGHLTDVVQQTGTLGLLRVQPQFGSHHSTEVSRLAGVLQQILAVRRAVFHLADNTNQFGMQAVDTEVDSRTLTRLDNLVVELLLHLGNHLLNAGGVDTTVADQLVQGQTAGLAAHGVEATDNNCFGRVVDDDFNATGCLQGTDVTTLTADDTTLHIVVIDMEHRDAILDSGLRGHALDGLDDNLLSLCISVQLGLVHNLVDVSLGVSAGLVLQTLHQTVASLLGTQSTKFLQLLALFQLHLLQLLLLHGEQFLLVVDTLLLVVKVILAAAKFLLALVQANLTLLQLVLALLDVLVALLYLLLQLCLLVQEFLLHLQQFFLLNHFGLLTGSRHHLVVFSL